MLIYYCCAFNYYYYILEEEDDCEKFLSKVKFNYTYEEEEFEDELI